MRTLAKTATGVLATAALLITPVLAGTSSAASPHQGAGASASHAAAAQPAHRPAAKPVHRPVAKPVHRPAVRPAAPSRAKAKVVLVGVVSATRTVSTSGTSTVLVTLTVQGGSDKDYRRGSVAQVTVTKDTVVKRGNGRKSRYEIKVGDKLTVHARRAADGTLTASYVAASGRHEAGPVATVPAATSTATTTATSR